MHKQGQYYIVVERKRDKIKRQKRKTESGVSNVYEKCSSIKNKPFNTASVQRMDKNR